METIGLKLSVDSVDAAQSVSDLKALIRDAKNEALKFEEGSAEFNKFADIAGKAKGKLNDVVEAANRFDPEKRAHSYAQLGGVMLGAFSAAQGAAALFGAKSEDVEKALVKVQSAMALLQGFQAIKDGSKAMQVLSVDVGNIIGKLGTLKTALISTGIGLLVAAVGLLAANWDKVKAAMNPALAAMDKSVELAQKEYDLAKNRNELVDTEVKMLKLKGANEETIYKFKLQAYNNELIALQQLIKAEAQRLVLLENQGKETNNWIDKWIGKGDVVTTIMNNAAKSLFGNSDEVDAQKQKLDDLSKQYGDITGKILDIKLNLQDLNKPIKEDTEKTKDWKLILQDINEETKKLRESQTDTFESINPSIAETTSYLDSLRDSYGKVEGAVNSLGDVQAKNAAKSEKDIQKEKERNRQKIAMAYDTLNVIQSFTELFGKKNEAAAKRAFQINKQAQAAQAIITTYQGATSAYASQIIPFDPTSIIRGYIAAGIVIAAGLANVAKIESQKFEGGGTSGGGSFSAPSVGGSSPVTSFTQPQTNLNQQNQTPMVIQNHIVESEMTGVQNRVKFLENASVIH